MHAVLTTRPVALVLKELGQRGVSVAGNPDVMVLTYTEFSVDDARQVTTYAFLKSVSDAKYFVISFDRAGVEAQNALLKVVEEAPGNSNFFFCTPNTGSIIPTLRSRCIVVGGTRDEVTDEAKTFLALSYAERLAQVEKMVTAAQRSGDRTPLRAFARALVHAHPSRETLVAARYLEQNGASPKLVFSHLAVALPH